MTSLKCKECKKIIIENILKLGTKQAYIQCPYCLRHIKNPIYEDER